MLDSGVGKCLQIFREGVEGFGGDELNMQAIRFPMLLSHMLRVRACAVSYVNKFSQLLWICSFRSYDLSLGDGHLFTSIALDFRPAFGGGFLRARDNSTRETFSEDFVVFMRCHWYIELIILNSPNLAGSWRKVEPRGPARKIDIIQIPHAPLHMSIYLLNTHDLRSSALLVLNIFLQSPCRTKSSSHLICMAHCCLQTPLLNSWIHMSVLLKPHLSPTFGADISWNTHGD